MLEGFDNLGASENLYIFKKSGGVFTLFISGLLLSYFSITKIKI